MSFRTTSTRMPQTSIWCRLVVTLVLYDFEYGIHEAVVAAEHGLDGDAHLFPLEFSVSPARLLDVSDGSIYVDG